MRVVRVLREWEAHGTSSDQGWFLGWEGHRNVRSESVWGQEGHWGLAEGIGSLARATPPHIRSR